MPNTLDVYRYIARLAHKAGRATQSVGGALTKPSMADATPAPATPVQQGPTDKLANLGADGLATILPPVAAPTSASSHPTTTSKTLAVSQQCPPSLQRQEWSSTDFELRALLYNGNISMVYHAVDKRSGITVALKLYKITKLTDIERHQVAREIRLHINLVHPSIIGMYAAWKDRMHIYMALEWAPGGDVYSYLRHNNGMLSEEVAASLIVQPFMSGLAALHDQGLIHRDIKPENVLLNNAYEVKIADFGLSIDLNHEVANTRLGTIDYLAPEILQCPVKQSPFDFKEDPSIGYTNKVDCWSCGVLVYELLTGKAPFVANTPYETLQLIQTKDVVYPPTMSKLVVDFLQQLLVRDPNKRLSIKEALDHPWLLQYTQRRRVRMPVRSSCSMSLPPTASTPCSSHGSHAADQPATPGAISSQPKISAAHQAAKNAAAVRTTKFMSLQTSASASPTTMAARVQGLTSGATNTSQPHATSAAPACHEPNPQLLKMYKLAPAAVHHT